jgi:hypothetical protein
MALFISCSQVVKKNVPVNIITKKEWGGNKHNKDIPKHTISKITIHHGGVDVSEEKDPFEYMRNLQKFSTDDKNWIDIPYHYCIDLAGKIYEARPLEFPGDTNTEYNPEGHALICVIGNYENQIISKKQLQSVIDLTAWLSNRFSVSVDSIASHKDYSKMTDCPGKDLYKYLQDGTIKNGVIQKLKEY